SFFKTEAARIFKEYIRYDVFADGVVGHFKRWTTGDPTLGMVYSLTAFGLMIQIADTNARNGDSSLYQYTTSEGLCGSQGGNKNLKFVLTELAKYIDHTYLRYGTDQPANNGNASYLIDSINNLTGNQWVFDNVLAQANVYYQDTHIQSIYKRTAS